jgi:pyruvate,water dikinase
MIWLKDADTTMGGKAYGLAELIKAGFKVPDGFVVSNDDIKLIISGEKSGLESFLDKFPTSTLFAVRSSAAAEDGSDNSYAGMFESKLNVPNSISEVISAIKYVNKSAGSLRVNEYSEGQEQFMNVVVQEMVEPRIAGVAFSKAVDTNGEDVILLEIVEGLADKLVSGKTKASRVIAQKKVSIDCDDQILLYGNALDCSGISDLVNQVRRAADYFERDMDIEWCIDSENTVFLVQARPITRVPVINEGSSSGIIASHGYAKGQSFVIDEDLDDEDILRLIEEFPDDAILVAATTDTQYLPAMKRASGIITEEGSALSHAAIVSREIGIPCIAGFRNALSLFPTGGQLTLDANNGSITYNGIVHQLTHKKSFNFADVYSFDNMIEMQFGDSIVLFQPTFDGIAMYTSWDTTIQDAESYEVFARKAFGSATVRCTNEKYAWYFEYSRFQMLPFFSDLCNSVKKACNQFDLEKISSLYKNAVSILEKIVCAKKKLNPYDKVVVEEICMAYHFILDMLLPNGYAIQSAYFKSLPLLKDESISFSDILNGVTLPDTEKKNSISQVYDFITLVGQCRNEICDKLVTLGAMTYDYFDTRIDRMQEGLKYANLDSNIDVSNVETAFYSSLSLSESVLSLTADLEKLV